MANTLIYAKTRKKTHTHTYTQIYTQCTLSYNAQCVKKRQMINAAQIITELNQLTATLLLQFQHQPNAYIHIFVCSYSLCNFLFVSLNGGAVWKPPNVEQATNRSNKCLAPAHCSLLVSHCSIVVFVVIRANVVTRSCATHTHTHTHLRILQVLFSNCL